MTLLWDTYVYRRNEEVPDLWDSLFQGRDARLLYIAGRGFDVRVVDALQSFIDCVEAGKYRISKADLVLVGFTRYELSEELSKLTKDNDEKLKAMFARLGSVQEVTVNALDANGEEVAPTVALYDGNKQVVEKIADQTDIILDVSSLPRVVYLSLITAILGKLIPNKTQPEALNAGGVNFQVLVAENPELDATIKSEDLSDELVLIPGFGSGWRTQSNKHWPIVWFPMLGENREMQFEKLVTLAGIQAKAEVCPVLPHPSSNPRRADELLVSYRQQLFESRDTPASNILYAHESNPFEVYRQLYNAMIRYKDSFEPLGGCHLAVSPLSSKLMTVGAGLACFEMKAADIKEKYAVTIPYVEPKRYSASVSELIGSSTLSCLLLTGQAYSIS